MYFSCTFMHSSFFTFCHITTLVHNYEAKWKLDMVLELFILFIYRSVHFSRIFRESMTFGDDFFSKPSQSDCMDSVCDVSVFKSCNRFWFWFMPGLWGGYSNPWIFAYQSYSMLALVVCLGSLSCWKVNFCLSLFTGGFSTVLLYSPPSLFPFTLTIFSHPLLLK